MQIIKNEKNNAYESGPMTQSSFNTNIRVKYPDLLLQTHCQIFQPCLKLIQSSTCTYPFYPFFQPFIHSSPSSDKKAYLLKLSPIVIFRCISTNTSNIRLRYFTGPAQTSPCHLLTPSFPSNYSTQPSIHS